MMWHQRHEKDFGAEKGFWSGKGLWSGKGFWSRKGLRDLAICVYGARWGELLEDS